MPRTPLRHAASALGSFARVLIQDSTTIALHPRLCRFFPGSAHPRATLASLKIQAIFDLCQSTFLGFELGSFRRNDQAASPLILHYCAAGDLVIRDLGYFVLPVLRAIAQKKAFFLSRLRADCVLYAPEGEEPLDLLAILRRQTRFEGWVRAGKQEKLPARLIAVPLPEGVAAERRRKAGANRDRRLHPSKASLALLGWEIFITNAEGEHLCPDQISALYGLRWRIETLFKAFKSHFALAHAPSHVSKNGVELFIYSKLLFIALFCLRAPLPSCRAPATRSASLSLLKLAQASALLLLPLALMPALGGSRPTAVSIASQLRYHCAYEERRRIHFGQCLQSLS